MSNSINLDNKYRVLLTEVLPYELPFRLNNDAFYENMQNKELKASFDEAVNNNKEWTIPFDYYVRRSNSRKSRKLSIMHPRTQLECVDFYEKYADYMLYLCSNNPFSIRYIGKKAQCVFKSEDICIDDVEEADEELHVEQTDDNVETKYRSYFQYEGYGLIYKFFSSGDYLRLEQKYSCMMKMDIASCFYHIYTHTMPWAIKGKEQAKMSIGKDIFGNIFDTLMRYANYNETNGIIVGPEISRIFAEIILSRIDVAVLNTLRDGAGLNGLQVGVDYEIRRYVDDYFVYANSGETLKRILAAYNEQLEFYKLFINESKLQFSSRPFGSDLGDAKREISQIMNRLKDRYSQKNEILQYQRRLRGGYKILLDLANEIRSITHQFKLQYGDINKYALKLLMYQIVDEMKKKAEPSQALLLSYVDVAFHLFALDMNVSASYKICRIIDYLIGWAQISTDKDAKVEVDNRICRESKRCIDIYQTQMGVSDTNLEILNMLLTLKQTTSFNVTEGNLRKIFSLDSSDDSSWDSLNYFQICTLLFIVGNDYHQYPTLKKSLVKVVKKRLNSNEIFIKADTTMLFFDVMVCPYIDDKAKKTIIRNCLNCNDSEKISEKLRKFNLTSRWFFDWDVTHKVWFFLDKKEYHSPYE